MASAGMTTLVIAHRLSTIKNADMIAVLVDGSVAETGTHEELLAKESHYYNLVEAQRTRVTAKPNEIAETDHNSSHGFTLEPSLHGNEDIILRFKDVHFEYPSRPQTPIFRGLNLSVRRGETLALVGPSGSGKSSTIALIEQFYRPSSGTVEFNGIDMKEYNVRWLRDQMGLVSQEPVLYDTTVEENIRYGCPDATQDQIIEAAKQANAHDFIMKFPDGYKTRVGAGSNLVSGGQKQRIAISRALVKQPSILLLDEATRYATVGYRVESLCAES